MDIQALAFDTGGTVFDWHSGIEAALLKVGGKRNELRDWHLVTNDYRRASMNAIVGQVRPAFNMDDVHRRTLDAVLAEHGLQSFTAQDRWQIRQAWYRLKTWSDFPGALNRLKRRFPVVSLTMLPLAMVVGVSRRNDIDWDAVIACEMIGAYKPQPEVYIQAAQWLNLEPANILMVACHNFDLNAARACGFQTAFVHRPKEWGPEAPPDSQPHSECSLVLNDFAALAKALCT